MSQMSQLKVVRTLDEDMAAIGLDDGVDPFIAGLPLTEADEVTDAAMIQAKADRRAALDVREDDDGDEDGEAYSEDVQDAALEIFNAARPQISEDLIDYDESEFNYDFLNSIAALIEAEMEDGADIDAAKVAVSESVSSTYNGLTLVEDDIDEDDLEERKGFKQSRTSKGTAKAGIQRRISTAKGGVKVKKTKVTGKMAMQRKVGQLKRKPKLKVTNKVKLRQSKRGKQKISKKRHARVMGASSTLADELRGLLSESVDSGVAGAALAGIQAELAEAFCRVVAVSEMLHNFFEEWADEEDQGIHVVLGELAEAADVHLGSVMVLSEDDLDLEVEMAKLQMYSKVLSRALTQYESYSLVDGEGNLIEMDDDDDDDDDDSEDGEESGNE
jgi:hypothetical protein